MKLKRKTNRIFFESAAASDLAFLLIIYFIVIAGFNINTGFLINLPERDSTRFVLHEDLLRFDMDASGEIIHEEKIIDIPQARTLIQSAHAGNPNIAVMLRIDGQAAWQRVVSFVELAQDLNIKTFSFSIKREAE